MITNQMNMEYMNMDQINKNDLSWINIKINTT